MSAHLDAPAYHRRPCPVPPAPVDATAELRRALAQERENHAFTLRALRAIVDTIEDHAGRRIVPGRADAPMALARSALEQFEGVS